MLAKKIACVMEEIDWITPSTMRVRFKAKTKFIFQPGQFLSLVIPSAQKRVKPIKRLYSIASPPDEGKANGTYELCVRYVKGGIGSEFIASSQPGDKFEIYAPYGDFQYRPPESGRSVCLIGTGSGIAPLRSIVLSSLFQESPPTQTLCLLGVRNETEKLYVEDFARVSGVQTHYAVSQPSASYTGYKGRVTDFLRDPPPGWNWHTTDFYLCGNGDMINEAVRILQGNQGVLSSAIQKEAFSVTSARPKHNVVPFPKSEQERESWKQRLSLRRKISEKI